MNAFLLLIALSAPGQMLPEDLIEPPEMPWVEQEVECISVAHLEDNVKLLFFWARVQGEWTCLDHRWAATTMCVARRGDEWLLSWTDENESCFRVVRTKCWVESWETVSPLAEQRNRPWFRQLLQPGLKKPLIRR